MTKKYTFEEFLMEEKFLKEEPQTLDDMIPDAFNDWLERLDVNDVIEYAQEYGDKLLIKKNKSKE